MRVGNLVWAVTAAIAVTLVTGWFALRQTPAGRESAPRRIAQRLPSRFLAVTSQTASFPYSGVWSSAPNRAVGTGSWYPPVSAEAVVTEQNGTLQGSFRARYQVKEGAISPYVHFRFQGAANGNAPLHWTDWSGAQGELELRPLSPDTLELEWTASELGSTLGISSGAAVLVRRRQ